MNVRDFLERTKMNSVFDLDRFVICPENSRTELAYYYAFPHLKVDEKAVTKSLTSATRERNRTNKRSEGKFLGKFVKPVIIDGFDAKTCEELGSYEIHSFDFEHSSNDDYVPVLTCYIHLEGVVEINEVTNTKEEVTPDFSYEEVD